MLARKDEIFHNFRLGSLVKSVRKKRRLAFRPPIEHKVFPHVSRAMDGVMLESHKQVLSLIEKTSTTTGLKVVGAIIDKMYNLGIKTAKKALDSLNIAYDERLPGLNYTICPAQSNSVQLIS